MAGKRERIKAAAVAARERASVILNSPASSYSAKLAVTAVTTLH
jgi:hypothetical protein